MITALLIILALLAQIGAVGGALQGTGWEPRVVIYGLLTWGICTALSIGAAMAAGARIWGV